MTCEQLGHAWSEAWQSDDQFVTIQECIRCHMIRQQRPRVVDWGLQQKNLMTKEEAEALLAPPEEQETDDATLHLMCIWCGKLCDDLEARYDHEDECAPA